MGRRGAVIVAAGRGTRMGEDKVWLPLGDLPVVGYCVRAFAAARSVDQIVLVVSPQNLQRGRELLSSLEVPGVACRGGERRQDSVRQGLNALGDVDLIAIHDGARPLVSTKLIEECYAVAERDGAAVAAVPLRDTVKRISGDGWVLETVDRAGLWAVQTPQVFDARLIRRAYASLQQEVTDDAAAVELLGHPVRVVHGDPRNMKLTTREDLELVRALLGLAARGAEA